MKGWRAYERYRLSGLWHVHTDVTDGANSPAEILSFAESNAFPFVGFVEHVRRSPTYDFQEFYRAVEARAEEYAPECAIGCEAKVLDVDGRIDVSADDAARADVVYAAYHGVPFAKDAYLESAHAMLANPIVDVWAHPLSYPIRNGFELSEGEIVELLDRAAAHDVLFERNLRYPSACDAHVLRAHAVGQIVGYDLHNVDDWDVLDTPIPASPKNRPSLGEQPSPEDRS